VQHDLVRCSRGEGVHCATHLGLGVFPSSATSAVLFGIGYAAATHDLVRYSRGEGVHRATHLGVGVFPSSAKSAVLFGIGYASVTVCLVAVKLLQWFRRLAGQAEG